MIAAVGGKSASGTDFYLAAPKLSLAQSLLVVVTLRETKANQLGILGFGGASTTIRDAGRGLCGLSHQPKFAVGAGYRTRPSNLE